jgi:hypothetical protein
MVPFKMQQRDEYAWWFLLTERSAAMARVAAAQQRACHSACHRNMAAVEQWRQEHEDLVGAV